MNMILTREQRTLFNSHWKSLIQHADKRPVKSEVFAELIIMRHPIENIQHALIHAFAPSRPQTIRTYVNYCKAKGVEVDEVKLDYLICQSYGYENFMGLWKTIIALRVKYFGNFHFTGATLPISRNPLHVSYKITLSQEQLAKLLTVIDNLQTFLRMRIEEIRIPTLTDVAEVA